MEPKCYPVKVLHYLSPHLIWVEVIPSSENAPSRQNLFEQVGVYGVLPQETTMDLVEDSIETCKSQEWCTGVVNVMDDYLLKAKGIWFSPMYEDFRASVFDTNIHKYGKFVVLDLKGDLVDLSKVLANTCFAYYDEDIFLHELTTFQLKTHLNRYKTAGIINVLEKCYTDSQKDKLEALKALTSIARAEQDLEDQLTNQHCRGGLKILPLTTENIRLTLERKQRDFQQCKDVDEISIGRGHSPNNTALEPQRSSRVKSSELATQQPDICNKDPVNLFRDTKKMLLSFAKRNAAQTRVSPIASPEKSAVTNDGSLVKNVMSGSSLHQSHSEQLSKGIKTDKSLLSSERPPQAIGCEETEPSKSLLKASLVIKDTEMLGEKLKNCDVFEENMNCSLHAEGISKETDSFEEHHEPVQAIKLARKKSPKQIIPEYDAKTQARVAYGPPDTDRSKLVLKVVTRWSNDQSFEVPGNESQLFEDQDTKANESEDPANAGPKNILQGLDSEIEYPVSNVQYLKSKAQASGDYITSVSKLDSKEDLPHRSQSKSHSVECKVSPTPVREAKINTVMPLASPDVPKADPRPTVSQRDALTSLLLRKKLSYVAQASESKKKFQSECHSEKICNAALSANDSPNSSLRRNERNFTTSTTMAEVLKKKLELLKKSQRRDSSSTTSDTSQKDMSSSSNEGIKTKNLVKTKHRHEKDSDSDESTLSSIVQKLNLNEEQTPIREAEKAVKQEIHNGKNHVNPFKNLDVSKFVEKFVSPVLLVHTKQNSRITPVYNLSDVNFSLPIHRVLKELSIKHPMTLQTVTWPSILRGYSLFVVSPADSGKTLGFIPAVCRLVADFDKDDMPESSGPIAIIVCATAVSVLHVERLCRRFLGHDKTVLSSYAGVDEKELMLSLLNGCDVFVCTPSALVRLLNVTEFGVDLRRLTTFVLDDCERLGEVYLNEIKFVLIKIKEMLRKRADKILKVQFVVASRMWCDFMEQLVSKAPNPMICIGSFQECVMYSKSGMSVQYMQKELKTDAVMTFMRSVDASKRTVIVCRTNEEVELVEQVLKKHNHVVFAGNNSETVEEIYNLSKNWAEYDVPLIGPVLVCCDSNLIELNITNAHNLLHYSLPSLYSMFSRRFSVLIDHFPSMFKELNETLKIKILLDENNVEQLPKILHFIKRCTNELPLSLDAICVKVLAEKDAVRARNLVPICENTMALGECPDIWNCRERHTFFKDCDEPKHWVPKTGFITFKIIHYHSAVCYSARLTANIVNGKTKEYRQLYSTLPFKMSMYYTKEANKRPHGVPEVGDVCAVAVRDNFIERCQVLKILNRYDKSGKPNYVLVKLIDEEKWERTRDVYLYHLPDDLKKINTHVVQVMLAGIQPKDRDITFSELAKQHLKRLTDKNDTIYMRAKVLMALSNTVLVDDLEACQDLSSMGETVVRYNFKEELLRTHAVPNPDHVEKLQEICIRDGVEIETAKVESVTKKAKVNELPEPRWAHLDEDSVHLVYFAWADNPEMFFIRLEKFEECLDLLTNDIQKYVEDGKSVAISKANENDIVLAKFPDDSKYYRARIEEILDDNKVKCFFVDHGDWRIVHVKDLREMIANFVTKLPFQAIECRLVGIKPVGDSWSEYSTNWLCDQCYEGNSDDLKELSVKYFTKEISECTGGHKYGIVLIDTSSDTVINDSMINYNLARENEEETEFLKELNFKRIKNTDSEDSEDCVIEVTEKQTVETDMSLEIAEAKQKLPSMNQIFLKKPIRSVPLVDSDDSDKWDVLFTPEDMKPIFKQITSNCVPQDVKAQVSDINVPFMPMIQENTQEAVKKDGSVCSSKLSDFELVPSPRHMIEALDSDDYSSPDVTQISAPSEPETDAQEYVLRKPKLLWRQNDKYVSIKILLIGVEKYEMEIQPRAVTFRTNLLDTEYGFDLDLYGVVDLKQSTHSSKGQYLYVKLKKLLKKQWMTLTRDTVVKKWIVYDPDDITASSDEDEDVHVKNETLKKIIVNNEDSDEEGDEMDGLLDDLSFRHKYHYDSD